MSASFNEEWMPFFGDRFWESERVIELSADAALLYQWLLWRQWKHDSLPPPDTLAKVVPARWGMRWPELWAEVAQFFDECPDGRWRNDTLAVEREVAERKREQAAEKGRAGGRAKAKALAEQALVAGGRRKPSSSTGTTPARTQAEAQVVAEPCPSSTPDRTVPNRTEPDRTNPPRGAALARSGPHAEFIAWWMGEWERTRLGTAYAFQDAKDGNAVSWLLKRPEGVEEVKVRALRLLESTDAWEAKNASLSLLRSRWNAMAVEVRSMSKQDRNDEAFRRVAEKLAARESLNGH